MFDSILLALSFAVTGEANAESRPTNDSAAVSAEVTSQIVAEVFEPVFSTTYRIGQPYPLPDIAEPEQVFRTESESLSSSAHQREDRIIDIGEHDAFSASDFPGSPLAVPHPREGWDYNNVNPFFHDGQPQSAEGELGNEIRQDGTPILTFWQDGPKATEAQYHDVRVEFAAANAMPTNVLIPLPLAAWSA